MPASRHSLRSFREHYAATPDRSGWMERKSTFHPQWKHGKPGVETVYQDLALAQSLDATTNIFLGREVLRTGLLGRFGFLDRKVMQTRSREMLETLNVSLKSMYYPINSLSGGQRQGVAIARATAWEEHVLILDEPTAALGVAQTRIVMELVRRLLRERGESISILLITHDLPRIFEVADRVTVLRHGRSVMTANIEDVSTEDLVTVMMGVGQ